MSAFDPNSVRYSARRIGLTWLICPAYRMASSRSLSSAGRFGPAPLAPRD